MTGKLIIFSAPSGSGKSTIINYLLTQNLNLAFSISATSRPPRGTEQHGVEYFFLTPEEFRSRIENNEFLEYEEVYKDRYYGTLKEQVEKGLETLTWVPKLTIIRVGENPDDISYEKGATKKLTSFGLEVESKVFPGDISDEAFKREFAAINADASVDGILMLRPLPKQINEQDIEKMIDPAKDLDGISPVNIAKVFSGDTSGFAPCTAEAVVCMLKMNDIALSGKRVAVVGRSMVVGRPLSMLLLHENATVTICHSRTANLPEVCREADILTACVGKAAMINHTYVKKDAVVIDVGINVDENGKLCGDVDFADLEGTASAATPVPGGVGGVTTAVLAQHLVRAARMKQEKNSNK